MSGSIRSFKKDVEPVVATAEGLGLDFFDIEFRICPAEVICLVAAYSVPTRFRHWSFGKKYHKHMLRHRYGVARIHELVYFSDPCQAFLLENNSPVENKLVAAHVIAHSDFFKNNVNFSAVRRDAPQMMACHDLFLEECAEVYGREAVEKLLDAALSIRHHIDPCCSGSGEGGLEKDVLLYISRNSPSLTGWQRQIIDLVREESCYFRPLLRTRFLNEGWAAYWHTRILREMDLDGLEAVEFARINAGALEADSGAVNPYRLGLGMFTKLAERMGVHGLFHLRREENDVSFLDKYLDEDLTLLLGLAAHRRGGTGLEDLEFSPKEVKEYLLRSLTNGGYPYVTVDRERSTGTNLYLIHWFNGTSLKPYSVKKTLEQIYYLWEGKIFLDTVVSGFPGVYSFDGARHETRISKRAGKVLCGHEY